jgi:hypothetical protein
MKNLLTYTLMILALAGTWKTIHDLYPFLADPMGVAPGKTAKTAKQAPR